MDVEAITLILFVWAILGFIFYIVVNEYVIVKDCKFYKKTIIRVLSGPIIMIATFVPDAFGCLINWLKQ